VKLVYQQIIDKDRGDCQTAAIATLLGLDYADVPRWVADAYDVDDLSTWYPTMLAWLRERGLHYLTIPWRYLGDWRGLVGALCLASMPSQRFPGGSHAVVGTWRKKDPEGGPGSAHEFIVLHDPNPLNGPYPDDVVPTQVSFLVSVDPGERADVLFDSEDKIRHSTTHRLAEELYDIVYAGEDPSEREVRWKWVSLGVRQLKDDHVKALARIAELEAAAAKPT
jgi:hypothetical protein